MHGIALQGVAGGERKCRAYQRSETKCNIWSSVGGGGGVGAAVPLLRGTWVGREWGGGGGGAIKAERECRLVLPCTCAAFEEGILHSRMGGLGTHPFGWG